MSLLGIGKKTVIKKNDAKSIESSKRRLLTVEVVEARGLKALTKSKSTFSSAPTSNPYGQIGFIDFTGSEIKSETFKIPPKTGTTTPKWSETFVFGHQYDLSNEDYLPSLVLSLFHKAQYDFSETPLGKVEIDLSTISCDKTDTWYALVPDQGKTMDVSGEVHLRLKFNIPAGASDEESQLIEKSWIEKASEGDQQLKEQMENELPNTLVMNLISGRDLPAVDRSLMGAKSSDPFVRFLVKGFKHADSSVIEKSVNPVWNETLRIEEVEDASLALEVTVMDYNNVLSNTTLGKFIIPLHSLTDKQPMQRSWKLLDKNGATDGKDRGVIDLKVQWVFDPAVKERMMKAREKKNSSAFGQIKNFGKMVLGEGTDSEGDDVEINDSKEAEKDPSEAEKKKLEEEKAAKVKELEEIDIKSGDYQILVHVIEARDLKAENLNGTSDPIVYISAFGQKCFTKVINNVTNCVFDEVHIMNFSNLDKTTFNEGFVRVAVYDSSVLPGNETMIGAYAMDAAQIYSLNKDHEFYRQWVPLMDDEDGADVGVQGYLKITIQIIGPGEKIKAHDEMADIEKELAAESKCGNDVSSLMASVPIIQREWLFLVVSIFRLEGLPVMDGAVGIRGMNVKDPGTDAFCTLSFAGGKPFRSKVKTVKGSTRLAINPVFNCDIWYPVSIPTMTQVAKLSVFDADSVSNELIGIVTEKFRAIEKQGRRMHVKWYNMYGCPEFKQGKLLDNAAKAGQGLVKGVEDTFAGGIDYAELYNNVPDRGTAWKGRALLQFRIETPENRPTKMRTPEIVPFRRKINAIPIKSEPQTSNYVLQAAVFSGANLPGFAGLNVTKMSFTQEMRVMISIGSFELSTAKVKYEKGMCRWNEFLKSDPLVLPKDVSQIPDIFIYLCKADGKPVTFCRLKPGDIKAETLIGFEQSAEWYLLQEDKSIDALTKDEFPGSLLIRLGFGLESEAKASESAWRKTLKDAGELQSYQMRVHVYQGSDLPAADSNGLTDPFVKCYFMDMSMATEVKKRTLYPAYYQTLVFDNITIPEIDNFRYAPILSFRLYDEDFGSGIKKSREYLGTFQYTLDQAFVTQDPDTPVSEFPEPTWFDFFKEVKGDGQGKLLVLVQLIPKLGRNISKEPTINITPETESAYIELIALGIRDLAPYNFQAVQAPFLELELNSFGTSFYTSTAISKKPNPANPNFLEKLTMEVRLPKKSIYATPLQIRCRDTRLGGFFKPIVGVGVADLSTKLPWTPNYIPPQTEVFIPAAVVVEADAETKEEGDDGILPGANNDEIAKDISEELKLQALELAGDKNIATIAQPSIETYVQKRVKEEDTGAGIFSALNHIDFDVEAKKKRKKTKTTEYKFAAVDFTEDDAEGPPAWKVGRKVLDTDLETELKTTPFETYKLTRGKVTGLLGSTLKLAGVFKGIIRVKKNKSDPEIFSKQLMDYFTKPKAYKVRLYCLHASALAAMDKDMFGRPTTSDPYLKIHLGKHKFNDRENYVPEVKEVDFYKLIEFDAELPGTSQLVIEVMDRDSIGSDDLIGKTVIDLEDRWFDGRWQNLGVENMIKPGDPAKPNVRWCTKPIETRTLYQPTSKFSQGLLQCYLDIMEPDQALAFPPDDVSLPPKQMFQIRVVIWKSKNVPPMDSLEKMSDLYVKVWPEGSKPLETDTHWRCKKGKASWNYRLLFDVELGHSTRLMKFPILHFQLWDRDLLKWNDCAGESIINIGPYLKKAFRKNVPIKMFEKPQGAAKRRAEKAAQIKRRDPAVLETGEDVPPPESGTVQEETISPLQKRPSAAINDLSDPVTSTPKREADSDDEEDADTGIGAIPRNSAAITKRRSMAAAPTAGTTRKDENGDDDDSKKKGKKGWFSWFGFGGGDEEDDEEEDEGDAADDKKDDDDEDDDGELKELLSTFKSLTGLWEDDPPDSSWLDLQTRDHNTNKVTPMGSICYSIQIWPKDKATLMSVGSGRNEPNNNPFLPPPVGRLKFSWNPFVLGSELCGPVLCAQLFCCLLCIAFILLMVFAQPFLTLMINLIFFFG